MKKYFNKFSLSSAVNMGGIGQKVVATPTQPKTTKCFTTANGKLIQMKINTVFYYFCFKPYRMAWLVHRDMAPTI